MEANHLRKVSVVVRLKERLVGAGGVLSGSSSIISAHNVCHSVCLAVVAALSIVGITVSSDILMFLQDYNFAFWTVGIIFLIAALWLYSKRPHCMPKNLIIANAGLLVIGIPFDFLHNHGWVLWLIGGSVVLFAVYSYVKGKWFNGL
jgi:hypothetical protein